MKIVKISFLFAIFFLLVPTVSYAQSSADKSWAPFWAQFSSAVNKKSKVGVKNLMSSEKDFSSGGGGESRNEWLQLIEQQRWWGRLQASVRSGTKPSQPYRGNPYRVTRDNGLVFGFIGGRWRFTGPMGD